ncbi:unnamed protein product [Calypogeia fissa]
MGTRSEGSKRLDKTLSSEDFAYKDNVSRLVKNHILKSSVAEDAGKVDHKETLLGGKHIDEVTQYWSGKVWQFLDELRSASTKHTGKLKPTDDNGGHPREWKLKDESERYRVMYREGPEGTPFHTLCLDGVVDGDFTSALCVAWETTLYKEWWPQFTVPAFKIIESKYLRRIRVGHDLSLLRFKVPWPLAQREVVMSIFEIDQLQEDLLIGVVESVPDSVELNENIHGFSAADLPPLTSNVRMELGGGFVMQRISKDQFFFRTIVSLDMKLDFMPPWLINFISRQLAGQGLKLYQKAVSAASNGTGSSGKAFQQALKSGYMYDRVRSGLEAKKEANGDTHGSPVAEKPPSIKDNVKPKSLQGSIRRMGSSEHNRVVPYPDESKESSEESEALVADEPVQPPLVSPLEHRDNQPLAEEVTSAKVAVEEIEPDVPKSAMAVQTHSTSFQNEDETREYDDPELVWAINILDKMISFTRSCATEEPTAAESRDTKVETPSLDSKEAAVSRVTPAKDSSKPPLPPAKNDYSNILEVKVASASNAIHKPENVESSRSRGLQPSGGDAGSSGNSSFWSTSEIEVISSQDDTDTDIGASGSVVSGQRIVQRPEIQMKRRWRKWRWTCFSPSMSKKPVVVHGRGNFYARDSGRVSEGHLRSLEVSGRYSRGYLTDGDERYVSKHRLDTQDRSPDRFVTLGELLLDGGR